jgi:hypothetical protein
MKLKHVVAAIAFLAVLFPLQTPAQYFLSGNQLYDDCMHPNNNFSNGLMAGFIIGVLEKTYHDGTAVLNFTPKKPNADLAASAEFAVTILDSIGVFCVPTKPDPKQLTDMFCKYLRDNPEERDQGGSSLVVRAMEKGFPQPSACKR